jgi:hypothetical protein
MQPPTAESGQEILIEMGKIRIRGPLEIGSCEIKTIITAIADAMTIEIIKACIFNCPGSTDLRKAVDMLTAMIEGQMSGEPLSGNVYLLCNKERKLLKSLWWDKRVLAVPEAAGVGHISLD